MVFLVFPTVNKYLGGCRCLVRMVQDRPGKPVLDYAPGLRGLGSCLDKSRKVSLGGSKLHVVNITTRKITWNSAMRGRQGYWRVLHSIERGMKGRRVLNYSHRRRREDSVLDSLWNRFLDRVHADESSDEDIAREDMEQGKLVQIISAETWQSEFITSPRRIQKLLSVAPHV